ncbi:transcriptional regulator BetI [Loktanella sp. SALINAS62]|uniref:choline-binding transcriptional repressor BetI n=1 Tax=Loktanella sp. SALINAS62 TaxID=2706124 RepID=UPI001B8C61DB|nr:transcriptional regulator BetI [Loktanella sp. SALINAS62]MBS1301205.1 transcriptional regulator BetI [Loktanella sp. SALINAS62]
MPRIGMEPIRRAALVDATIAEVGYKGTLDVTVAQIARRAGVSSALAHHYFGGKAQLFSAAMRTILKRYGDSVRRAQAAADTPHERLAAIINASFAAENFHRDAVAAWMNFYVQARVSDEVRRLLDIYQGRLRSNLQHDLRLIIGDRAPPVADTIAALIDGIYIRAALTTKVIDGAEAAQRTLSTLNLLLEKS